MRNKTLMLFAGAVFVVSGLLTYHEVSAAKAPAKPIEIKGCKKAKSAVTFDHKAHSKVAKCDTCHHKVSGKTPAQKDCSSCHMKPQGSLGTCQDKSTKKNPFHVKCIGCHKKMKAEHAKAPTSCKKCHK